MASGVAEKPLPASGGEWRGMATFLRSRDILSPVGRHMFSLTISQTRFVDHCEAVHRLSHSDLVRLTIYADATPHSTGGLLNLKYRSLLLNQLVRLRSLALRATTFSVLSCHGCAMLSRVCLYRVGDAAFVTAVAVLRGLEALSLSGCPAPLAVSEDVWQLSVKGAKAAPGIISVVDTLAKSLLILRVHATVSGQRGTEYIQQLCLHLPEHLMTLELYIQLHPVQCFDSAIIEGITARMWLPYLRKLLIHVDGVTIVGETLYNATALAAGSPLLRTLDIAANGTVVGCMVDFNGLRHVPGFVSAMSYASVAASVWHSFRHQGSTSRLHRYVARLLESAAFYSLCRGHNGSQFLQHIVRFLEHRQAATGLGTRMAYLFGLVSRPHAAHGRLGAYPFCAARLQQEMLLLRAAAARVRALLRPRPPRAVSGITWVWQCS